MKISDITEAPIQDFQLVGDFNKAYSMRSRTDRRLLSNPRYVERIKSMFRNTEVNFNIFMVNTREAWIGSADPPDPGYRQTHEPHLQKGEVTVEWLQANMPDTLAQIQQQGGKFDGQTINILFTNNIGDERRPMTGWMIAHRAAHVLMTQASGQRNQYNSSVNFFGMLFKELKNTITYLMQMYGTEIPREKSTDWYQRQQPDFDAYMILNSLLPQIGTFKSAREKKITRLGEFIFECFAQYLLNGAVKFNTPGEPLVTRYNWGRPEHRGRRYAQVERSEAETAVDTLANTMEQEFSRALHMSVGKIFVM